MHPARVFHEGDQSILRARVAERGFALIAGVEGGRPVVAHAPVLLDGLRLRFHLSAVNPLAVALRGAPWALAVVTGEDAYVSPDWYAAPDQVPTWNYVSVEIAGAVEPLAPQATRHLLDDLAARYESALAPKPPWTRAKMSPARFEALLAAIVGFELKVERFQGVTKLSQNKSVEEVGRVAAHLAELEDAGGRGIATRMLSLSQES
jgi:transcriptional regulator